MQIVVRDNIFEIDLVNNWVREKYDDMLGLVSDLTGIGDEVDLLIKEAEGKTLIEQKEIGLKIKEKSKELRTVKKEIGTLRNDIIRELIESNELKYDLNFWDRKCDVDDINNFMLTALRKDVAQGGTSKKK